MSDLKTPVDPSALFLGPQGQNAERLERALLDAVRDHVYWRRGFHPEDPDAVDPFRQQSPAFRYTESRFESAERRLLARLKQSVPFHSPRYIGHMSSDTLIAAQVGYLAAMLYNPNNVAFEGSPVTTELEDEVIADLCGLCGFDPESSWGTLCGGGTIANLHALWVYRNLARTSGHHRFCVLVPASHHYSWVKAADLLGFDADALVAVEVDSALRMRLDALEAALEASQRAGRRVLACVGVAGSTEGGAIDPIDGILALRDEHQRRYGERFFVHVDAAYGGYARAILRADDGELRSFEAVDQDGLAFERGTYDALVAVRHADGVTIDPHKLGFVPYPAGALLLRDKQWRSACSTHAPYLNADSNDHRGTFTLEGSRPGAAAAACWLAHRTVPLDRTGYGEILRESLLASRGLAELLDERVVVDHRCVVLTPPTLDVLLYAFVPTPDASLESVNACSERVLRQLGPRGQGPFGLASTTLDFTTLGEAVLPFLQRLGVPAGQWKPGAKLKVLRSVMMTPFVSSRTLKAFYRSRLLEALAQALDDHPGGSRVR